MSLDLGMSGLSSLLDLSYIFLAKATSKWYLILSVHHIRRIIMSVDSITGDDTFYLLAKVVSATLLCEVTIFSLRSIINL